MKNIKTYEFYTGPKKAIGYKHYQEDNFAFFIDTTDEGIKNFKSTKDEFSAYLKFLGFDKLRILIDTPKRFSKDWLLKRNNTIVMIFKSVNEFEAMSIIEEVKKYLDHNQIPIKKAGMKKSVPDVITHTDDVYDNATDITKYIDQLSRKTVTNKNKIGFK